MGGVDFFAFNVLIFSKKSFIKGSWLPCDGSWACFSVGFTAGLQQRNVAITTCGVSQARALWDLLLYTTLKGIMIFKVADTCVFKVLLRGAYFLDVRMVFNGQVGRKALGDSEY